MVSVDQAYMVGHMKFEMPRKDGIYTMASYLEKYQVLDELKKIDKFKSEGKI